MIRRTILVVVVLASLVGTSLAAIEAEQANVNDTPPSDNVPEESTMPLAGGMTATTLIVIIVLSLVVIALVVALVARKP